MSASKKVHMARIYLCGPEARVGLGDYVWGADGEVYIVISLGGSIHPGTSGQDNSMTAEVVLGDWRDVESDPTCRCVLEASE